MLSAVNKAKVIVMSWPDGGAAGSSSWFSQIGTRVPAAVLATAGSVTAVSSPDLSPPPGAGQRAMTSHAGVSLLYGAPWIRIAVAGRSPASVARCD